MKKIVFLLFAIIFAIITAGCEPTTGYDSIIDTFCSSIEDMDANALVALLDIRSIEKGFSCFTISSSEKGSSDINVSLAYCRQQNFKKFCTSLENKFGKNFTVSHMRLVVDKDKFNLRQLKSLKNHKNENEHPETSEFINSFIDGLQEVVVLKTSLVVKSENNKVTSFIDTTMHLYNLNGRWYLDYVNYSDIKTPNLLDIVEKMLKKRC